MKKQKTYKLGVYRDNNKYIAHNKKEIWNPRIKLDFEQCRHIEKRRQFEVSAMPKHDFLSQARTNSQKVFPEKDAQLYSGFDVPLQRMKNDIKLVNRAQIIESLLPRHFL